MPASTSIKDIDDLRRSVAGPKQFLKEVDDHSVPVREPRIRFYSPSELGSYKSENVVLVGNSHLIPGEVFVIGGEPGVGKSKAATQLAVCGATGTSWFGMSVHRRFRTMIIQTENGRYRLQQEYGSLDCHELDEWIRVSEPPPFGLTLSNEEFQADIRAELESFKPDCVILDPWNAATKDDKQVDYFNTFEKLRNILPTGKDKPALGIVAHTRKPLPNEKRTGGTGLMHILSGSHLLASVPRSLFVMVRGSDDECDNSVIWCNPKNSNGPLESRSAWARTVDGFEPLPEFDWENFDKPPESRRKVSLEHIQQVFEGTQELTLSEAAARLSETAGITQRSAYNALKRDGFARHLHRVNGNIRFIP